MIRLVRSSLAAVLPDQGKRAVLSQRQRHAAALTPGAKVIGSRWNSFVAGTGKNRGVGPVLCKAARAMSHEKCAWCEAPRAATIDHFWPKTTHPAKMFDWENLFAACRDCNSEKGSSFPTSHGRAVLLNPVDDEPLDHFRWSHVTGECLYDPADVRADETHREFALDRLAHERLHKMTALRFYFVRAVNGPVDDALRAQIRAELDATRAYLGIVRSYLLFPPDAEAELVRRAVAAVPEIIAWTAPWLRPPAGVAWPPG